MCTLTGSISSNSAKEEGLLTRQPVLMLHFQCRQRAALGGRWAACKGQRPITHQSTGAAAAQTKVASLACQQTSIVPYYATIPLSTVSKQKLIATATCFAAGFDDNACNVTVRKYFSQTMSALARCGRGHNQNSRQLTSARATVQSCNRMGMFCVPCAPSPHQIRQTVSLQNLALIQPGNLSQLRRSLLSPEVNPDMSRH